LIIGDQFNINSHGGILAVCGQNFNVRNILFKI
jgi:hypothetical protein